MKFITKKVFSVIKEKKIQVITNKGMRGNTENCLIIHRSQTGLATRNYIEKSEIYTSNLGASREREDKNILCTQNCYQFPKMIYWV